MERVWSTSGGGFSVRSILMFGLAVFATALLWATFSSTPANAATAEWKGDSLLYDYRQYFPMPNAQAGESHGLEAGTQYYMSLEGEEGSDNRKAYVIYFAPGTSPPNETEATFVVYNYSATETFSNPQDRQTIEVTIKEDTSSYSSCSVEGIGWIICPVTVFLADSMDNLFVMVSSLVAVQPLIVNNTNSPLYISWNVMRTIANVAFIIAFLVIIYSQITSYGVSNYGLKRLLPRLIIAAILVNISFYVSAVAVDLSNIAGYSLQDVLIKIREQTFAVTNQTWSADATSLTNWSNIAALVLSGGAIVGGISAAGIATGTSVASALYMLVPLLIGLVLTILFVLLILAARQAIIVILIVISPLAFVANLLPNTEKWYSKWQDLFMNMLIFFPAFSLVFGGSQLAGGIIIQNASNVIMMIFGMAVQVAPLIITPLILKLSGGILGRIAGLLNDPRRGMLDRTKNWAGARSNMHKQRALSQSTTKNPFRRMVQRFDNKERDVKERTSMYEQRSENRYRDSARFARTNEMKHDTETDRKYIDARLERDLHTRMGTSPKAFEHQMRTSNMVDSAEIAKKAYEATMNEAKAGTAPTGMAGHSDITQMVQNAQQLAVQRAAEDARVVSANGQLQRNIAEAFNVELKEDKSNQAEYIASQALLRTAGGIQGQTGMTRAQSNAAATLTKLNQEALSNNMSLLEDRALAQGRSVKDYAVDVSKLARSSDPQVRASLTSDMVEAAYELLAKDGQMIPFEEARADLNIDQTIIDRVIARNVPTMKSKGGFHLQAKPGLSLQRYIEAAKTDPATYGSTMAEIEQKFTADLSRAQIDSLSNTPADGFGGVKFGTFDMIAGKIDSLVKYMDPVNNEGDKATLKRLHEAMQIALNDDTISANMTDRLAQARKIDETLSSELGLPPVPPPDRTHS